MLRDAVKAKMVAYLTLFAFSFHKDELSIQCIIVRTNGDPALALGPNENRTEFFSCFLLYLRLSLCAFAF